MLAACQTTCMAYHQAFWVVARTAAVAPPYHEAFWVVVGTAGPVVALAAVVAWAQVNTQIERFQQNPNQLPPAFYLYFLVWMLLLVCIMIETVAARDAQIAALAALVEELRRRLDKDSSTSSKPPSSDSPYTKKPRDRSLRGRSGRRPGKQPGAQSSTLRQSPDPGERGVVRQAACGCCGQDLTGEPVLGTVQKRQVFEASPPPPPVVTEYQVAAKCCPDCGEISVGLAPAGVTGQVQYGPGVHAKAALAVCAPPARRPRRAARRRADPRERLGRVHGQHPGQGRPAAGAVLDRVRELLPAAGCCTPTRPRPGRSKLHYVHVACTEFLTAMHTGDRTKEAIDAGGVLPGYAGTIVRDSYKGYEHLTDALHAWCGAHGLRDLAGLYRFDPRGQVWARSMATCSSTPTPQATAARAAGQASLNDAQSAFGLSLAILLDRRETAREQLWGLFLAIGGLCVMWGASLWFGLVRIAERADAIANKSAPVLASGSNASEQSAEVSLEHESKRAEQQPEQEAKPAEQPNGKSPQDQPRSKHTGIAGGLLVVGIALGYTASRLRWLHRSGRPVRRQR